MSYRAIQSYRRVHPSSNPSPIALGALISKVLTLARTYAPKSPFGDKRLAWRQFALPSEQTL